jgi:hypothetical protein
MSVNDLAAAFEALVGEPPEKRNKLWMLKRMEQAAAARGAVDRAAARASGGTEDGGSEREVASEPAMEPADGPVARTPCIDPVLDGGSFVTEAFSRGRSVSA